jgi:hypothetical protein
MLGGNAHRCQPDTRDITLDSDPRITPPRSNAMADLVIITTAVTG